MLKALFKVKDGEQDFTRAIEIAIEKEDAAKMAKDTVHGVKPKLVHMFAPQHSSKAKETKPVTCRSAWHYCGDETHQVPQCRFMDSECKFCGIKGYISKVGRNNLQMSVKVIHEVKAVNEQSLPKLEVPLEIQGRTCRMELDTATNGKFISSKTCSDSGSAELQKPNLQYDSESRPSLPIITTFVAKTPCWDHYC